MNTIQPKYVTDRCGICYADYKTDDLCLALKCGHLFHKNCFTEFYAQNPRRMPQCFLCNQITRLEFSPITRSLFGMVRPTGRSYTITLAVGFLANTVNKTLYHYNHYRNAETDKICLSRWRQQGYVSAQTVLMCWFTVFLCITFTLIGKVFLEWHNANRNAPKEIRYSKN